MTTTDIRTAHTVHATDAARMVSAARNIRDSGHDCGASLDLAALLADIAGVLRTVADPPLGEVELYRWSALVHRANRIAKAWA